MTCVSGWSAQEVCENQDVEVFLRWSIELEQCVDEPTLLGLEFRAGVKSH